MKRKQAESISRPQKYDGSCINPDRGMSSRAKRQGTHRLRQALKQDLLEQIESTMTEYVCCYVEDQGRLLLIEKRKPLWQKGRWNLPGGKIEEGERPEEAAKRELFEEANLKTIMVRVVGEIRGDSWTVHIVQCWTPHPQNLQTMTDEEVFWKDIHVALSTPLLIPNLRLIIPLVAHGITNFVVHDSDRPESNEHFNVELSCVAFG